MTHRNKLIGKIRKRYRVEYCNRYVWVLDKVNMKYTIQLSIHDAVNYMAEQVINDSLWIRLHRIFHA